MPQYSLEPTEANPRAQKDHNEPNMSVPRRSDVVGLSSHGTSSPERHLTGIGVQRGHPTDPLKSGLQAATPLRYRRSASGRDDTDTDVHMDMGTRIDAFDGLSDARTSTSTPLDEMPRSAPLQRISEPESQARRRAPNPSPPTVHQTSLDRADQVSTLAAQVQELRDAQRRHIEKAKELETRIGEDELACGRMIETALEIGRTIELKKKHLAEDRLELSRARRSRDETMQRVDEIMAQIGRIALGAAPSEDASSAR